MKLTPDQYKQMFSDKMSGEYYMTGEYAGVAVKTEMMHTICNRTYMGQPNSILSGINKCPHCRHDNSARKKFPKIIAFLNLAKDFELIEADIDAITIKAKHLFCGNITTYTTSYLKGFSHANRPPCTHCKNHSSKDRNKLILAKELRELTKGAIKLVKYTTRQEKATFECTLCKHQHAGFVVKFLERPMCRNNDCTNSYIYKKNHKLLTEEEIEKFCEEDPYRKHQGLGKRRNRNIINREVFDFPEGTVILTKDGQELTKWPELIEYNKWHPEEKLLENNRHLHPEARGLISNSGTTKNQPEVVKTETEHQDYNNIQWKDAEGNPVSYQDVASEYKNISMPPLESHERQLSLAEKLKIAQERKKKKKQKKQSQKKSKKKKR